MNRLGTVSLRIRQRLGGAHPHHLPPLQTVQPDPGAAPVLVGHPRADHAGDLLHPGRLAVGVGARGHAHLHHADAAVGPPRVSADLADGDGGAVTHGSLPGAGPTALRRGRCRCRCRAVTRRRQARPGRPNDPSDRTPPAPPAGPAARSGRGQPRSPPCVASVTRRRETSASSSRHRRSNLRLTSQRSGCWLMSCSAASRVSSRKTS